MATIVPSSSAAASTATVTAKNNLSAAAVAARRRAQRQTSTEDERRMKFLALLCGRGAFREESGGGRPSGMLPTPLSSVSRERSASVGGMGAMAGDGGGNAPAKKDLPSGRSLGKGAENSAAAVSIAKPASARDASESTNPEDLPRNYVPTTPSNLSRRILHKSSVGYLDQSVPLLLSAMSDRFLATVLVQGMACRDRRLEGRKALRKERRRRERHRRKVLRERRGRERRYNEETAKRRLKAEGAVKEGERLKEQLGQSRKKGLPMLPPRETKGTMFLGGEKEGEAARQFRKQAKDVDDEEDYYNSYYGGNDNEEGEGSDDDYVNDSEEEEEESDDDEEPDATQYDLKLRDLIRPLGAWGFDLTGKVGFSEEIDDGLSEEEEYEDNDAVNNAEGGEDEEEDEDQQEEKDDDDLASDEEDGDPGTTDDEAGEAKKKKVPSPKKKSKGKKAAGGVMGGGGAKKSGAGGGVKKKTTKRKRDDKEDDGDNKGDGKPKAKKAAVSSSAATAAGGVDAKQGGKEMDNSKSAKALTSGSKGPAAGATKKYDV